MNAKVGGESRDFQGNDSAAQEPALTHSVATPHGGLVEQLSTPAVTEQLSMLMFGHSLPTAGDAADNVQHALSSRPG